MKIPIKKILKKKGLKKFNKRPSIFLDRDGTINHDKGYTYRYNEFKYKPYVLKGLKYLSKKKYLIFIVTNQAGIAKGKFKLSDLFKLHKKVKKNLHKKGIVINEIQYCPFHPRGIIKKYRKRTNLRKPGNLMIIKIFKKWKINYKNAFMIGDKKSDKIAAKKSGLYFEYPKNNFFNQVKRIDKKITNNY